MGTDIRSSTGAAILSLLLAEKGVVCSLRNMGALREQTEQTIRYRAALWRGRDCMRKLNLKTFDFMVSCKISLAGYMQSFLQSFDNLELFIS
jgi:hypothetical protein